jgi:hypothetical protein
MAMNKKEQAAMAALQDELRKAKALRWTEPVKKDVPPPTGGISALTSGFVFNAYSARVDPAWSSCVTHGVGMPAPSNRYSGSQNCISMFSTRLLALRALRHAVELETATKLAGIDLQIEKELSATNQGKE